MDSSSSKIATVKLFIDKGKNKVMFAEGGKEFVDYLFNILTLPVGKVTENKKAGFANVYQSVKDPKNDFMSSNVLTELLSKPSVVCSHSRGYVREGATFIVMDDLTVLDKSSTSMDLSGLEERVVDFGINEGSSILKHCGSLTVLTNVFIGEVIIEKAGC